MLELIGSSLSSWHRRNDRGWPPARVATLAALAYVTLYAAWAISLRDRSTALGIALDDLTVVPLNLALVAVMVWAARADQPSAGERRALWCLAAMYACTAVGNVVWYLYDARQDGSADYGPSILIYLPCYVLGIAALSAIPLQPLSIEARRRYRWDLGIVVLCVSVLAALFTIPHLNELWTSNGHVVLDGAHALGNFALAITLARTLLRPLAGTAPRYMRLVMWGMSAQVVFDLARQMAVAGPSWEAPVWLYPLLAIGYVVMIGATVSMRARPGLRALSAVGAAVHATSALPVVAVVVTFFALLVGGRRHTELAGESLILAATIVGAAMLAHHRQSLVEQARVTAALAAADAERRFDRRLRETEKQEALGRMASGVAHDFNNMITAIVANCELAADDLAADASTQVELHEIRAAAMRGADLTRQLLMFSRQEQPAATAVDLPTVLLDIHRLLQRVAGDRVQVMLDAEPMPGSVHIDRGQFEQVIVNLVANARDAMQGVGRIDIAVVRRVLDARDAGALNLAPGPYLAVSVADTGSGIPADALPHIFDPFFTTKAVGEGTGLGLATAANVIRAAGGAIHARNGRVVGACFELVLPHADAAPDAMGSTATGRPTPARAGDVVLVVEDDATVRQITRLVLARAGYTVLSAASIEDAHRVLQRWRGRLDLVLADVVLPDGTGPAFAEEMARRDPSIPVVLMSGYAPEELGQFAVEPLRTRLLRKPFTPNAVQEAVRTALDDRSAAPTGAPWSMSAVPAGSAG